MSVLVTEYLRINLETEQWECRHCGHAHGSARENYKKFLLIYPRNPQEIHRPLIDPARYTFNFSPDPKVCVIYEFYCPDCGTLVETEYSVPGHEPLHDIDLDIDALKKQWADRKPLAEGGAGPETSKQPISQCCHGH